MPLSRPHVLILSIDRAFARDLSAHWPADPNPPEFTVLDGALFRARGGSYYDLAIADATAPESREVLKPALAAAGKPALLIHANESLPFTHSDGAIIEIQSGKARKGPSSEVLLWAEMAGLVGREILRRSLAEARQREAESVCAAVKAEATLGRYMVEMRHNANNALTSVLGNAELLTLEPGLPRKVLDQADTIRNMALRLHEIFQRFSSLEKELSVAARESGKAQVRAGAASAS
jgi:signal transduction histidine kinase